MTESHSRPGMNPSNAARRTMSVVAATLAMLPLGGRASAQSTTDWTYEIGLRTTFMVSTMRLAELGGGFADLPAGGKALPHSSSIFVLWPIGQHVRVGIETLVGNSYPKSDTQMLFQASGLTAEYQTGGAWFVAAGVQAGGMIVSATQSPDPNPEGDAQGDGVHYKESGVFLSPQISLGRRLRRYEVKLVGRQVWQFGAAGVDAFDSFYAGISVGRLMR